MPKRRGATGERKFNKKKLLQALQALSDELQRRGVRAEVFAVGGGAMVLAYSARRVTRDLDAIFEPKSVVYDAARVVAEELALPADWLNDAARPYLPGDDPDRRVVFSTPSLVVIVVSVASPRYLLAMKLLASRVDDDTDDIRHLYEMLGLTTADEGLDLVETFYPREREPKTQFLLEELFGPVRPRPKLDAGEPDDVGSRRHGSGRTATRSRLSAARRKPAER